MNSEEILFKNLGVKYYADKVNHHGYHFYYPKFLSEYKDEQFNLLEIGYQHGNSYYLWQEYFPKAKIFSADLNPIKVDQSHILLKCDQNKIEDLQYLVNEVKTAKIIIDDGTHQPTHQAQTFHYLFQNLLSFGGVYIIEDIECNYWNPDAEIWGYKIGTLNCIDYTKKFIDQINEEFSGIKNKYHISSVTYGQNCVIIKKQTEEELNYFNRQYRLRDKL